VCRRPSQGAGTIARLLKFPRLSVNSIDSRSAFASLNRVLLLFLFFSLSSLFRDRPEDRGGAPTRRWTSTRAMHPAWKKRSPYCERYRQRTKTCNVQVSCTARAHVAISCGKFRLDSTYVTSSRVPPHRRFDFLLRLRKLRFESEKRLALRGRTMRTGERASERASEREREREREKKLGLVRYIVQGVPDAFFPAILCSEFRVEFNVDEK